MKQTQPFQKHWLQIISIVVCRLKGDWYIYDRVCIPLGLHSPAYVNEIMLALIILRTVHKYLILNMC